MIKDEGLTRWSPGSKEASFGFNELIDASSQIRESQHIIINEETQQLGVGLKGHIASNHSLKETFPLVGLIPPLYPEWLGDRSFQSVHNTRFSYIGGAMARGIASAELVIALAESGMMGFFGSAGLSLNRLEKELNTLTSALNPRGLPWGMNLIHTPNELHLESAIVDLYIKYGVNKVEAAAFMGMSKALAQFAFTGLQQDQQGNIVRKHHVFAKISRPEVAKHFLTPVPSALLNTLVSEGKLTADEANLASQICLAEDITVESDSGGHTDGRPLGPLFSEILQLRNQLCAQYQYPTWPRVGAAGGLGTPTAVAAAFSMGAAYVCIGSVHQACVESGMSSLGKKMLGEAGLADVALTACADMFEQGVKVQVLKRGTLMSQRGNYLYNLYINHKSIDEIPARDLEKLEQQIFKAPLTEIWTETEAFFTKVEPSQVVRAATEPKHKMALIFRWYIGKSSQWPLQATTDRQLDYQIWCGPALGAFNQWVKGTFLEPVENRQVKQD